MISKHQEYSGEKINSSQRKANTWHIHLEGQVQGVGFRPFVYSLADVFGLKGWVNNTSDGVHIEFNAEKPVADNFYGTLLKKAPALAQITGHHFSETEPRSFDDFKIIHSEATGRASLLLTPDFALCKDCKKELHDPSNRRHHYPFITCTNCGPRFSIIKKLPYDRINTEMDAFTMCPVCQNEYENPGDRRFYSQTNSCPDCSITLRLFDIQKNEIASDPNAIIALVNRFWQDGKIVAIKGIGGYLLTCDAGNPTAILELRKRKHRPTKPLALLFPDLATLEKTVHLKSEEIQELTGPVSPIILADFKDNKESFICKNEIAPGLDQIGVILPYAPLFDLLLKKYKRPVIATSGNVSNSPIIFQDENALEELSGIADFILTNNRKILVPQDDSVVKYSPFKTQKIIIRRSRGLAPTYISAALEWPDKTILATGAMLKSTFSLLHQGNTYISQYLGDLEHFDTLQSYEYSVDHFFKLFDLKPELILTDKHPAYTSTVYGKRMAKALQSPFLSIQHHIAHFGAVLGENNLIHSKEPVLGVIWDGTGLGDDDQIWGGEFFKYEHYDFFRCNYFAYFDFILGDKMPREPRISALSACWKVKGAEFFLKEKFTKTEWQVYSRLLSKKNPLQTSSAGRIFDAVASLLGLMNIQTYEGEAAMILEALATRYFKENDLDFASSYFSEEVQLDRIPTKSLMAGILKDLQKEEPRDFIAAKFHFSLVVLIKNVAKSLKIKKLAFSGGVFQNSLLVDLIIHHLGDNFDLFFHRQLSPNDENVSFGQLICYQISQYKSAFIKTKN